MNLYSKSEGQGDEVVLLHGWGMNSEVWFEVVDRLRASYRLTVVDLPGHGFSREVNCEFSPEAIVQQLSRQLPSCCVLVGWSLGGLLALQYALAYPTRVSRLILVASNAQFIQADNWSYAMKPVVLNRFIQNLKEDYRGTLQQFLLLQTLGADHARQTVKELKRRLYLHGEPDITALEAGLEILQNLSMVSVLHEVRCPTLLINGKLDTLVPVSAGQQMQKLIPQCELKVIEKAAHAPFISHSDQFVDDIRSFLKFSAQ